MKYFYVKVCFLFVILGIISATSNVYADLPLIGKVIVIDAGHGSID